MPNAADLQIAVVVSAPFEENSYIAHLPGRQDALVFDPGLDPEAIIVYLDQHQLTPAALVVTHGHADHIAGLGPLKERWPDCPIAIGAGDAEKLIDANKNLSAAFGLPIVTPPADLLLKHGETYSAGGMTFDVREIPGHSSGHVVFIWREGQPNVVFGGDVLFNGSIGRTDFPDGDFARLAAGIHAHLFTLPDDTVVLSGHGPRTTIGREKRHNPFVGENVVDMLEDE